MRRIVHLLVASTAVVAGSTLSAPAASADGTWTVISSPAGAGQRYFPFPNRTGGPALFAVNGTTSPDLTPGTDTIDVHCFTQSGAQAGPALNQGGQLTITASHHFSGTVIQPESACVLRAVPSTYSGIDTSTGRNTGYVGAFSGPSWYPASYVVDNHAQTVQATGRRGFVNTFSPGDLGLFAVQPVDDVSKTAGNLSQLVSLALPGATVTATGEGSRSTIKVDGHNTYTPYSLGGIADPTATPSIGFSKVHHADGTFTSTETDPLRWCDGDGYPQSAGTCAVRATGVKLVRTYRTTQDNTVVFVHDRFVSVDGHRHTLNIQYANELVGTSGGGSPGWKLPGHSAYVFPASNGPVTKLKAGVRTVVTTNDIHGTDGDLQHAVEGATYSGPPALYVGLESSQSALFSWRYARRITAAHPAAFGFAVETGFSQATVKPLSHATELALTPHLRISHPPRTTTDNTPTVRGRITNASNGLPETVRITIGTKSKTVAVDAAGRFHATFTLVNGKHTVRVRSTDPAGLLLAAGRAFTIT
jgi:glucodextranase-like protein